MLCNIFLLITICGFSTIDAGSLVEKRNYRQRRNYATPEDLSVLERNIYSMQKSIDKLNDVINGLEMKVTESLAEKEKPVNDWIEKLQSIDRKLDRLQRSQEEQDSYGNKLTALEFTLNHVLSKVVYLSENIPIRGGEAFDMQNPNLLNTKKNNEIEILARLNDLLRHVQSIKRNKCGRITLPASAAGINPLASNNNEKITTNSKNSCKNSNCGIGNGNATVIAEELFKLIVRGLNTEAFASFQQLPLIAKRQSEQIEDIMHLVKETYKRLEHMMATDTEDGEQQNWQRMLQYCQDVSDEFSSFAGSSDALMKRIESFLRDMAHRIGGIPYKRKNSSIACAGKKTNNAYDDSSTGSEKININSSTRGFDTDKVHIMPDLTDCHELSDFGNLDGIYRFSTPDLNSAGRDFNTRYCAFATDERAWTVIQRRGPYDIQENFNRSWIEYRDGFGELNKDFWFGNEFIHLLTSNNNYELLIELENFDGGKMSISYGSFSLDRERNNYSLFISDYKGPGPDSLSYHSFMDFSTYDHSNHNAVGVCCSCAIGYGSGWWFDNCLESNLNGIYRFEALNHSYVGIIWQHWLGDYSLKASRMLVRPKNWTLISDGDEDGVKWLEDP